MDDDDENIRFEEGCLVSSWQSSNIGRSRGVIR